MNSQILSEEAIKKDMERVQAAAAMENELGPGRPPPVPPRPQSIQSAFYLRRNFEETMRQAKNGSGGGIIKKEFVGTEKHFSETPLRDLDRVAFKDMLVRKVHRGKYLLCRVVAPSTRLVAVEFTAEDPEGDVLLVSLFNFPSMINAGVEELDALFHIGTILAIREPYRKTSLHDGKSSFIRVDSPSDVIFLSPRDSTLLKDINWRFGSRVHGTPTFPTTVSGWKELGNKHFNHSRWFCATVAYTKGLLIDPRFAVLRANRAEAYLRLKYYSAALSDAESVLGCSDIPDAVRRKASFRAGKAEYERGNFDAAIGHFKIISSEDASAREWINRATTRISETTLGQYDWLRLFLDSQNAASTLDVADFVGPIKIECLPGRVGGRGVVATQDISVGELLVVAKPFACAFKRDLPPKDMIMSFNMITKKVSGGCDGMTLSRMVEKLHGNPELSDLVYHLCPGSPSFPPPPQSYPPLATDSLPPHPLEFGVDINIALLEHVFSTNQFSPQSLRYADFKQFGSVEQDRMASPSAIYTLPSLFNHACAANSFQMFFGEVMVIRASARIVQGEEITLSYIWGTTAISRQKQLDNWHFRCTCLLCEEDRADGDRACQDREELLEHMNRMDEPAPRARAEASNTNINKLMSLVQEASRTYAPGRGAVCSLLAQLHHRLASELQLAARDDPRLHYKVIVEEIKALEAAGVVVIDKSIDGPIDQPQTRLPISMNRCPVQDAPDSCVVKMLINVGSFLCLGDRARTERWLRAAWWLEDMTVGGGRSLFEERYKKLLSEGIIRFSKTMGTT